VTVGAPVLPGEAWTSWSLQPSVVAGLALVGYLYARGTRRLPGRTARMSPRRRHVAGFYAGLAALAAALVSPLDRLAGALFAAHMTQHLVLIAVASPLLVYGRPALPLRLGLGRGPRTRVPPAAIPALRRLRCLSNNPLLVGGLHGVVLWAWHLPGLYTAALRNGAIHAAEHVSFLLTGLLFWRLVIRRSPKAKLPYAPAILLVFVTSLQSGALGALLTFAPSVLYPVHGGGPAAWGLTPLEDQQLAGAIMWVPQGMLYLATIAVLLWRSFLEPEARSRREEAERGGGALGFGRRP
jgi:putative membrane protein